MDIKVMPRSNIVHIYILCIIDEVMNYLIMVLIHHSRSKEIADALIENVITKYCVPDYIIMDQDSMFMSSLMNMEHGIKSLSTILTKHLTNLGQMWPKYLPLATFACNTFNSPNLANYSPYELVFSRKPKLLNLDASYQSDRNF